MTIEPLFESGPHVPKAQSCGSCLTPALASDDTLRILGWLVYDGTSLAGQELHVRKCPPCQIRGARDMEETRRGEDPCTQIPLL